ncbi:MAG TPA: hypothetical protein VKI41_16100 [Vicinamibacteria bacterium]|nr:hypothetical protein [Vicinamibacteria bacterium]
MNRVLARLLILTAFLLLGRSSRADEASIAAGVGTVEPTNVNSTLWITGSVRFPLGRFFAIEPEIGYWSRSAEIFAVQASLSDLNFGATALIVVPIDPIRIFFGAGACAHRIEGRLGVAGLGSASDSTTKGGYQVLGGIELKVGRSLSLFGAARYDGVKLDNGANLDQTKFYGGLRLRL